MKHKYFFHSFPIILVLMVIGLFTFLPEKTERSLYENFILEEASFLKNANGQSTSDIKSPDKPDEAAFQEYIITVDPELGYVPIERLWKANKYTAQKIKEGKSNREYDPIMNWELTGANMGGRTRALMFDPNDPNHEKVWAGGVTGGLWYTDDITDTDEQWVAVGDFWSNLAISSLAYDPTNTETFYVGTGEAQTARIIYRESSGVGAGIFKSTDAGASWQLMDSTTKFEYITDIAVRDENGVGVIYAAVASGTYMGNDHESQPTDGLFRSDDGGLNWEQVLPLIPGFSNLPYTPADIEIASNGRIFVGTMENLNGQGGATVLYSDNGKAGTWSTYDYYHTKISNESYYKIPARTIVASAASNPDVVYAQFAAGYQSDFVRYRGRYMAKSVDGGETWSQLTKPDNDWSTLAWHAFILKVDPGNENAVFTGGLDLWRSGNGGGSWRHVSDWSLMYWGGGDEYVHADQHNIQYQPESPETSIFSCDGGVFLTNTANQNYPVFIERNQGYNTLQFYSCAISPNPGAKRYIGGLQDNGTLYYKGSPLDINDMIDGGDGAFCFWDQNQSNIFITSIYYNRYTTWSNGNEMDYIDGESGTFISPADYDYKLNTLYSNAVGFDGSRADQLFRLEGVPNDLDWQFINLGTGSTVPFSHIAYSRYSETGTATLFVGTTSGKLFKVSDAHSVPVSSEIGSPDFPAASLSCVAIGDSEDELLVTFSNYGVSSVWLTKDGGDTWEEKESNLPDMPVRWALFHPDNSGQALLATETGIWSTNTLMEDYTEWAPANDDLANVRVDMLKIRYGDDVVLAATHGRGLATAEYELDIYTGMEESPLFTSSISIYPNPASDHFTLTGDLLERSDLSITISDLNGRNVYTQQKQFESGTFQFNVNVSDLSKGIYIVKTDAGGKAASNKLIIQ